ncbi:protein lethal(2)essential for life [Bemisia tabaci]|nr:PREDICTED: protein lethal(2)essential for life-like [Bemisia tabaci]AVL92582.1 caspase-1 [Bemisia tabaci]WCO04819.1 heat shock protein 19.5 [Bemisia tabaci]
MALLPYLLEELNRPTIYDQNFGLGLFNDDFPSAVGSLRPYYLRPWRLFPHDESGISSVQHDKDGFKVNLDVQQFKPEEVNVKIADNYVIVNAKHEERSDEHGFISREFTRRYLLPKDVNAEALTSSLSSDGVLSIQAPPKAITNDKGNERQIPVTKTNAPAIKQQQQQQKK